ncbi:MAG: hypothetical protein ACO22K_00940, partial [Woeseiaceae bacterium]
HGDDQRHRVAGLAGDDGLRCFEAFIHIHARKNTSTERPLTRRQISHARYRARVTASRRFPAPAAGLKPGSSGTVARQATPCASALPTETMITATNTACQPKTFFEGAMPNASLYEASKKKKDS